MKEITISEIEKAKLIQPAIKKFLQDAPMHTGAGMTMLMAIWHVREIAKLTEVLNQLPNDVDSGIVAQPVNTFNTP